MFLNFSNKDKNSLAVIDDSEHKITYGDLIDFSNEMYGVIQKRTLILILSENCTSSLAAYVGCLIKGVVPLILSASTDRMNVEHIVNLYRPEFIWMPNDKSVLYPYEIVMSNKDYKLGCTGMKTYPLNEDLALLLTTSGSTGSPKFVRHSYRNLEANAKNVSKVFGLTPEEKGMVSLPLHFTQGLNVATSHLYSGSKVLLSRANLMQKEFWEFFKENEATSFTGVPYSIELINRLRFFSMELPHFKTLNQGGGRLSDKLFVKCAQYAKDTGRLFVATYGSTETTSRMAYLPPKFALEKCGSIGLPIPEGEIILENENGEVIDDPNVIGEIVYYGPNVTLGYAEKGEDLILGDERKGVYKTGDLGYKDEDGFYFITARKKRFLKLFGHRISLDETEGMVSNEFDIQCACTGSDEKMIIYITDEKLKKDVILFISEKTSIHSTAFAIKIIDSIPKNEAGKPLYNKLPE